AYSMKCFCVPGPLNPAGTYVDHVRLFRNHPRLRWKYRVHEQILGAVRDLGGDVRFTDVVIHHTGYVDPALRARKLRRDLRLLRWGREAAPDEPFSLFNLGQSLLDLGQPGEASKALRRSLERCDPNASIVRKLFALLSACARSLGRLPEALK